MSNMDQQEMASWVGRTLVDSDGDKIGKIADIYLDEDTDKPEWIAVNTGMFGSKVSFVPIEGASASGGDEIRVRHAKSAVKDAPNAEADGALSQDDEARLYSHYGMSYGEARSDSGLPEGGQSGQQRTADTSTTTDTTERKGDAGAADNAMTRSEEELRVAKTKQEAGRVRLRKWVDTERVTETVPVQREEVRVEREAITDANRDKALDGPEITEAVHEIVLTDEKAIADTEVVAQERIRLDKEVVTEQETVTADLRKERVEVEGDTDVDTTRGTAPTNR